MEKLWQDLRYSLRMLAKEPAFTLVAVLSMALGIGANTAIFSLTDRILVRTLPVVEPERLVIVGVRFPEGIDTSFNYPLYKDYRDQNDVFSGLLCYSEIPLSLGGRWSERIQGMIVSGNYFSVLGIKPALGRAFRANEDQIPGASPVALISYEFWQRRLEMDRAVIGTKITLNDHDFTVIGVAPAEFTGTRRGYAPEIYVPMAMVAQAMPMHINPLSMRQFTWLLMMGRLKPGITIRQAEERIRNLAAQIARIEPMNTYPNLVLAGGSQGDTAMVRELSTPVKLLMATVGLILLMACANVANLLLARAGMRAKEIAIRLSIGAGRWRVIRQLLTESVVISAAGGALGLVLAFWLGDVLVAFRPPGMAASSFDAALDLRVLAFAVSISILTGIVFGLAPALRISRPELVPALKQGVVTIGHGNRRWTLRNLLLVLQVALSLIVLISAGLCIRSVIKLQSISAGFDLSKVLTMSMDLELNSYTEAKGRQFYASLLERVSALPGVEAASLARIVPLGDSGMRMTVQVEGHQSRPGSPINFSLNIIAPSYFKTMGTPILRGRDFGPQDTNEGPGVVIVNETVERQYWPGQSAIGKHLTRSAFPGRPAQVMEVIGVARDSKYRRLTETIPPTMYFPLAQHYTAGMALHVRTAGEPSAMIEAIRKQVQSFDPNLPLFAVRTLEEQKRNSLYAQRMAAILLTSFGGLALLLASVGIYGLLSYAVSRRTREIGIRMALGAVGKHVLKLVMMDGMVMLALGMALGLIASFLSMRLIGAFLYGITAADPATFAAITALLVAVALLATYIPSRRATRVDPMTALRDE
ncbi:MAG TPA: ABC transporter permease [Acidobacteriota bacterium]|jgi:predicted permease